MATAMGYYNPHSVDSKFDWDGLRSAKFGKTKYFLPKRDLINTGTTQTIFRF